MTATAGEIWLAGGGDETRRPVFIVSDTRFHRLAERAVVAPLLDVPPAALRPWYVGVGDEVVAVNQLGAMPIDRLLEPVHRVGFETLRQVRRAVREITT